MEIGRQTDYIPLDDHDCGGQSRGFGLGAGLRANGDQPRLKLADQRAAFLCSHQGAALCSSSPRIRIGTRPRLLRCPHLPILHFPYCSYLGGQHQ